MLSPEDEHAVMEEALAQYEDDLLHDIVGHLLEIDPSARVRLRDLAEEHGIPIPGDAE